MVIVKNKKAATLIEVTIVILIVGIIGSMTVAFFIPMTQLIFYLPSQLMAEQTAEELLYILIEGDSNAKGLRYVKLITSADQGDITFVNWDDDTIRYRWDATEERIYRNINSTGENPIPYSYHKTMIVKGASSDSEIFQFYNSSAVKLSVPVGTVTSIEAVRMDLIVQDGTGNIKVNEGRINVKTGIDIKTY